MYHTILMVLLTTIATLRAQVIPIDKEFYLNSHNEYRRAEPAANMKELVWSSEAEKAAGNWALRCQFEHENKGWGENLAFNAMPDNPTMKGKIKDMMAGWHKEKNEYSYGQQSCIPACHYTQLVWANTSEVGCVLQKCVPFYSFGQTITMDTYYLVCFYKVKGNNPGPPFVQGAHCSKCPSGMTCKEKLCHGKEQGNAEDKNKETTGKEEDKEKETKTEDEQGKGTKEGGKNQNGGENDKETPKDESDSGLGDAIDRIEKKKLLNIHNKIRKTEGRSPLKWDNQLDIVVKSIIHCTIQYPASAKEYGNFQMVKAGSLSTVVKKWAKEDIKSDLNGYGCIGLNNNVRCNRHANVIAKDAKMMACAAKKCGSSGRQLTCLYRVL